LQEFNFQAVFLMVYKNEAKRRFFSQKRLSFPVIVYISGVAAANGQYNSLVHATIHELLKATGNLFCTYRNAALAWQKGLIQTQGTATHLAQPIPHYP